MPPKVMLERMGSVAHVVLNRPDKLNAIDADVLRRLREAVAEIEADPSVRVVVVRGVGRAFSAGADLEAIDGIVGDPDAFAAFMADWHQTYDALAACSRPTIAEVHGVALAGGFELMQVCDLAIVADDARLGDQHARYGLFPGGGSTQRLPRMIGERRAKWLLLSGEWLTAQQALDFGLANELVPATDLRGHVDKVASLLASRSATASAAIKEAIRLGSGREIGEALGAERPIALRHMASQAARIGLSAFRSRTPPDFSGH